MSIEEFNPSSVVLSIHGIPRFGHSNSIALLASSSTSEEYKDGIVAFSIFLIICFTLWTVGLLVLKLYYGKGRVGCAAGGEVVDVKQLKKVENLNKKERKARILRNWRVQTACMLACISLLTVSMLMLRLGLDPFVASLEDLQEINDLVDSRAYRGILIVSQLQKAYDNLQELQHSGMLADTLTDQQICPNLTTTEDVPVASNSSFNASTLLGFSPNMLQENVVSGLNHMESVIMRYDLESAAEILFQVTNATASVDTGIDGMYSHDWMIKLLVVIMDVVVIFLFIGILVTKENTDLPAYQAFTSWVLLPSFCVLLIATVGGTCTFASMAMLNADFCAGGDNPGSPLGAIQEMIAKNGYDAKSLPYLALEYYGADCLSTNPLAFLTGIESTVSDTHSKISELYSILNSNSLSSIVEACGDINSILVANATLYTLEQNLFNMRGTLSALVDLTGCSSISPVFRRLFFGSTCSVSVNGLAWLYSSLLSISILGFVIVSTRAALFNPVIRGRRSKRREKEFADYKLFMSKFYNTANWELDWIPDFGDDDMDPQLPECDSEDTRSASTISPSNSDEMSQDDEANTTTVGLAPTTVMSKESSIFENLAAPDDNDDDSYDSTYSVDANADDGDLSTSTFSAFNLLLLKKRMQSQKQRDSSLNAESQDELLSSISSSSFTTRFLARRFGRHSLSLRGDALSLHPPDQHNEVSDRNDDDSQEDGNDSTAGIMMTPPAMRYPVNLRRLAGSRRSLARQEPPDDPEMEPLTPSPQQLASMQHEDSQNASSNEPKTLSRRSSYR